MADSIALIAGLGNPGNQYADTRHNAGFRFLDRVIQVTGASLKYEAKFSGAVGKTVIAGRDVWLLAPSTFMNHSGEAVAALARFYKIPPGEILVAHDELDLAPGCVRLKIGGGHGGHNGLRDIVPRLGSADFVRLRIGIGHPGSAHLVSAYVLKPVPVAEQRLIDGAIDAAVDHLDAIVAGDFQRVMNDLHTHALGPV